MKLGMSALRGKIVKDAEFGFYLKDKQTKDGAEFYIVFEDRTILKTEHYYDEMSVEVNYPDGTEVRSKCHDEWIKHSDG